MYEPIMCIKIENKQKEVKAQQNLPTLFEDAITSTGFGKFNVLLIILSGTILTQTVVETTSALSFVLPVAQCDLELTTGDKGILGSVAFFGIIVTSHLWGFLADILGRKKIMQTTLFLSFICTVISSFANGFWFLLIFRFLSGCFVSGSSAAVYAYLSEFHNKQNQSKSIFGATIVYSILGLLVPWIALFFLNQDWSVTISIVSVVFKPWRLYLIACGFPSFICAIVLFTLPESPKFVLLDGDQNQAINIIKRIHKINNGSKAKELYITSIIDEHSGESNTRKIGKSLSSFLKLVWDQTAPLYYMKHIRTTLIIHTIQFGTFMVSLGMNMWFPAFINMVAEYTKQFPDQKITFCEILTSTESFDSQQKENATSFINECSGKLDIASFTSFFYSEIIYLVGFTVLGLTVNYIGKLPIILFVLVSCGGAGILMTFVNSPILFLILFIVLGQCGLVTPLINLIAVELYPTNLRAMAVCLALMMGRLGCVFGSTIVGYFLKYSCNGTFWFFSIELIVCGVFAIFIPNIFYRTKIQDSRPG